MYTENIETYSYNTTEFWILSTRRKLVDHLCKMVQSIESHQFCDLF